MRFLLLPLLAVALSAGDTLPPEDDILAAARAADSVYQRHVATLVHDLADPAPAVRLAAIAFLGRLQDPTVIEDLMPFLVASTKSVDELSAAAISLARLGAGERAATPLRQLLSHKDDRVRVAATNALDLLAKTTTPDQVGRAQDSNDSLRLGALTMLGAQQINDAGDRMALALRQDRRPLVRRSCAIGLGKLGDKTRIPDLRTALTDADPAVRRYAAEGLVKLDDKAGIAHLLMALEANIAGDHIRRSLVLLAGNDFGFDPKAALPQRTAAIDRGFTWWGEHAKEFGVH
ncbi:hypothetical protein LBMAG53_13250 [Planctomycetota bacterium]|nr:hypothetical protein LBMAG53_13250 [Planctomycetota bacterium]